MQRHEVLVIGGGSTGCSVLYHLAKAGVKDPLLVDMAPQLAAGQTSRSTALVRTHYSTETLTKMALLSYRFFRDFGRELPGRSAGYVETGLLVGADEASVQALRQNSAMHKSLGIDSRVLRPRRAGGVGNRAEARRGGLLPLCLRATRRVRGAFDHRERVRLRRGRARREGPHGHARHQDRARPLARGRILGLDHRRARQLPERRPGERGLVQAALRRARRRPPPEGVEASRRDLRPSARLPRHEAGRLRLSAFCLLQARGQRAPLRREPLARARRVWRRRRPGRLRRGDHLRGGRRLLKVRLGRVPRHGRLGDVSAGVRGALRQHP